MVFIICLSLQTYNPLNKLLLFCILCINIYNTKENRGEMMLLTIDMESETPIYQQISEQLIIGIAKQEVRSGELLPSVRQLADEIGVNMMTVSKAYTFLKNAGYIVTDRRNGTKVAEKQALDHSFSQRFSTSLELLLAEAAIHQLPKEAIHQEVEAIYQKFEQ
jgi:GntR family transcriptional regulator